MKVQFFIQQLKKTIYTWVCKYQIVLSLHNTFSLGVTVPLYSGAQETDFDQFTDRRSLMNEVLRQVFSCAAIGINLLESETNLDHLTGKQHSAQVHSTPHRYTAHLTGTQHTSQVHSTPHRYTAHLTGKQHTSQVHNIPHR